MGKTDKEIQYNNVNAKNLVSSQREPKYNLVGVGGKASTCLKKLKDEQDLFRQQGKREMRISGHSIRVFCLEQIGMAGD